MKMLTRCEMKPLLTRSQIEFSFLQLATRLPTRLMDRARAHFPFLQRTYIGSSSEINVEKLSLAGSMPCSSHCRSSIDLQQNT